MTRCADDWFRPSPRYALALSYIRESLPLGVPHALRRSVALLSPPPIATGATVERFRLLAEVAALDLSLGRVFEGHVDALDILRAAGLQPRSGVYGVWAAATDLLTVTASPQVGRLTGTKPYCSGAPYLDHALVTALSAGESQLFEIDRDDSLRVVPDTWSAIGMAASESFSIAFDQSPIVQPVGAPDFYTQRPGFWQGSLNVAACWFGGALGLARGILSMLNRDTNAHHWAAFGALASDVEMMQTMLDRAARATDRDPLDIAARAQQRAFSTRHIVYHGANRVLDWATEIGGTAGFTHDAAQSRRLADLPIYLRQHHPGPDAEAVGRMTFQRFADG